MLILSNVMLCVANFLHVGFIMSCNYVYILCVLKLRLFHDFMFFIMLLDCKFGDETFFICV